MYGCGSSCPSWIAKLAYIWGPSITKVDLQGNLPHRDRIKQVNDVPRRDLKDVSRCHPQSSVNIAATSTTSAGAGNR
ncbi:hypothetical protein DPMN_142009 [Dreissena polymorpha]|uniref:Uncharacterized protein n=1 Tax=Dreissena polymorpha TaxID=45954 RepID=A0A9D4GAV0_DREPO|nr:hypothetical protein DPMN_142009 [Dreissena polymorpha]